MDLTRRNFVLTASSSLALSLTTPTADAAVIDSRMWPAPEYTRLTIESNTPIRYTYFTLNGPSRLVINLQDTQVSKALLKLSKSVSSRDPFVKSVRVAQYSPDVVRIVFDLKQSIRTEVFSLNPVANYKNRLIFDLYPGDPIQGMLAELKKQPTDTSSPKHVKHVTQEKAPQKTKKVVTRSEQPKNKIPVIVIDAGHGGEDSGAVGKYRTYEKHVALSIAKRLQALIKADPYMTCVMTRSSDHFVTLADRVMKAQKVKANLFVSIHADAWRDRSVKGSSVFALAERGATSSAAMWLAKNQNEADLIGGAKLDDFDKKVSNVLVDMTTAWKIDYSLQLGHEILNKISKFNALHKRQVEQAGFLVLKTPGVPSVLVETAFISNPNEERKLQSSSYQQNIALAIYQGIKSQIKRNPSIF